MEKKTKKKLWIVAIAFVSFVLVGVIGFHLAVNLLFSKVTDGIISTNILQDESGKIVLPVLDGKTGESIAVELDAEDVKKLEERISVGDKAAVLLLLASTLPKDEYTKVMAFLEGGISQKEYEEAYEILRKNLTDDQKTQVKEYYAKYFHLLLEE